MRKSHYPYVIGCFDPGKDYFPSDDMFEEFAPEVPYRHIFPVDPFDSKTMNGGELDALEENRSYKVKLNKDILRSLGNWKKGTKVDLLRGTKDEKMKIWEGNSGSISLDDMAGVFTFKTIA
jgi:hypothetical protein